MRNESCHVWVAADLHALQQAAVETRDAPEVWAPVDHPHLAAIVGLWPNATLRTIGTTPPPVRGAHHLHLDAEPALIEQYTLERPRRTVVCPWPDVPPSVSAQSPAAQS